MSEKSFKIRSARFMDFNILFLIFFNGKQFWKIKRLFYFKNVLILIDKEYSNAKKVFKFKNYMLPIVLNNHN